MDIYLTCVLLRRSFHATIHSVRALELFMSRDSATVAFRRHAVSSGMTIFSASGARVFGECLTMGYVVTLAQLHSLSEIPAKIAKFFTLERYSVHITG